MIIPMGNYDREVSMAELRELKRRNLAAPLSLADVTLVDALLSLIITTGEKPRCFNCEEETGPLMEVTKGVAPVLPDAHGIMLKHGVDSIRLCEQCFGAFHCRGEFVPDGKEAS